MPMSYAYDVCIHWKTTIIIDHLVTKWCIYFFIDGSLNCICIPLGWFVLDVTPVTSSVNLPIQRLTSHIITKVRWPNTKPTISTEPVAVCANKASLRLTNAFTLGLDYIRFFHFWNNTLNTSFKQQSTIFQNRRPSFWMIFTHLKLWIT